MGESYSKEEETIFASTMFRLAQKSGLMPDIGIDDSLMKFSGLNSIAVLQDYSSQLSMDLAEKAPQYIESLGSTLADLKGVPSAVGLGALIISFILDLAIISVTSKESDSTMNMMRHVFAEEKASGVRDTMDESIKRLSMHMWEPLKAQEETERLEKQLSYQLTRLRNSMLHDDQMSTRAMKHWINGAAFHSQMLIHAARLKMARSSPVHETDLEKCKTSISNVVMIYQSGLQELLKKYKTYKRKNIAFEVDANRPFCIGAPLCFPMGCAVRDSENGIRSPTIMESQFSNRYCGPSPDAYVDYMFNNWNLIKQLDKYFCDLKKNLKQLILQRQAFNG